MDDGLCSVNATTELRSDYTVYSVLSRYPLIGHNKYGYLIARGLRTSLSLRTLHLPSIFCMPARWTFRRGHCCPNGDDRLSTSLRWTLLGALGRGLRAAATAELLRLTPQSVSLFCVDRWPHLCAITRIYAVFLLLALLVKSLV